ncbi:MAG: hypothetical protein AAFY34_16390 [Pseudomonadota bacterium]
MTRKPPFWPMAISLASSVALIAFALASQTVSSRIKSKSLIDIDDLALSTAPLSAARYEDFNEASNMQTPPVEFAGLLGASPFHAKREPFSRAALARRSEQPKPELRPEIVGFVGKGDRRRVMIDWRNGSPIGTYSVGDDTPFGLLTELQSTSLSFEHSDGNRQLELFD